MNQVKLEEKYRHYPRTFRKAPWLSERDYCLNDSLIAFFREQRTKKNYEIIDSIPEFWLYCVGHLNGEVGFLRNEKETLLRGTIGVFIPFFSIVHWKFYCEKFFWYGYQGARTESKLPVNSPVYFETSDIAFFNEEDILKHILDHKNKWKSMGAERKKSSVAIRTKNYIDSHIYQDIKISQISKDLGYSHDVMTRQFKKMFSITPSQYLRDLRYYQAVIKITNSDQNLVKIAETVGVDNYENFSKVFKHVFKTPPKSFREKGLL